MSGPHGTPISMYMGNITSTSKRHMPARASDRFGHQDGGASVQNFSDTPGKPILREGISVLCQRYTLEVLSGPNGQPTCVAIAAKLSWQSTRVAVVMVAP